MEFNRFLNAMGDEPIRQHWWKLFEQARQIAERLVNGWAMGRLEQVILADDCSWCPNGIIRISRQALEDGGIFHELFHAVLHESPFKIKAESNAPDYRLYCESLCNVFQYFMEQQFGVEGNWTRRMKGWQNKNWTQLITDSGDLSWDMTYGLPAQQLIKDWGNLVAFSQLFTVMNGKSG
jgi:hypothetical protein